MSPSSADDNAGHCHSLSVPPSPSCLIQSMGSSPQFLRSKSSGSSDARDDTPNNKLSSFNRLDTGETAHSSTDSIDNNRSKLKAAEAADNTPSSSTTRRKRGFLPKPRTSSGSSLLSRLSSKNSRSESATSVGEVGSAVESSAAYDEIVKGGNDKSNNSSGSSKQKRSMHLNIAPDSPNSESIHVTLVGEDGPRPSPIKGDNGCIYTVGSVDYLVKVKPDTPSNDTSLMQPDIEKVNLSDVGPGKTSNNTKDSTVQSAAEGEGGSSEKKKSRMSGLFKKSGKKGGSGVGGDDEEKQGGGEGSSGNNDDDNNNGDQNDEKGEDSDAGGSKDEDNDDEKKDSGGDDDGDKEEPSKNGPFDPLTHFGPQRLQFASDSTLPIHVGSESSAPTDSPSWTPVNGTEFKVRIGPNYPRNGKKEQSLPSLYEVYCVRYYRSTKRTVGGATTIMPLPEVVEGGGSDMPEGENLFGKEGTVQITQSCPQPQSRMEDEGNNNDDNEEEKAEENVGREEAVEGGEDEEGEDTNTSSSNVPISSGSGGHHYPELEGTKIPDVLVVHFMLPYEPPNMFKQKDDGPGGECVYYLRPSQRFLDEYSGRIPATPATHLFAKWCNECEGNFKMRSRFKCMALVRDIDRHNFGLLKNYNGKPVLITESGRVCSGYQGDVRYLEMTANGE